MQIIPALELQSGRPVSLFRGRLDEPQIWHVDPVETLRGYAQAGADWVHVTDFDAVEGKPPQDDLLQDLIRAAETSLQMGGGIRSRERAAHLLDMGVGRLVLGTVAVSYPGFVKELANQYPDQIVLAVDVFEGRVMSHGWRETSTYSPADFIGWFQGDPLAAVMVTDIDSNISEAEASLALVSELAGQSPHAVIANGLARSLDDIARLKYVRNVSGTVVGRSLFSKDLDLAEALALAAEPIEEVAKFI